MITVITMVKPWFLPWPWPLVNDNPPPMPVVKSSLNSSTEHTANLISAVESGLDLFCPAVIWNLSIQCQLQWTRKSRDFFEQFRRGGPKLDRCEPWRRIHVCAPSQIFRLSKISRFPKSDFFGIFSAHPRHPVCIQHLHHGLHCIPPFNLHPQFHITI